jgi:predicted Fe-Mo cluster-binding NifX family protein
MIHGWHGNRDTSGVLIAVPNCHGRVSPVFDVAARLLLVSLKGQAELDRYEIVLFEKRSHGLVRDLKELGITVLICGGISEGLQVALERVGIRVLSQVCGEVEAIITAYRRGTLNDAEFIMPGCCERRWGAQDRKSRYKRLSKARRPCV